MTHLARGLLAIAMFVPSLTALAADPWQHPLSLSGGGWWAKRIAVVVENGGDAPANGEPAVVRIGGGPGEASLVGQPAKAIRVTNAEGAELLFALNGPDGNPLDNGPIPAGSTLAIPVECEAKASATYYIYFDNPTAGLVPDALAARLGVANGDVEAGEGAVPQGWRHDVPDAQHRATWSEESPQSGKHCLKTVVDAGAEPTWIATRQGNIHVAGGAKYRMQAWVKAENVKGTVGWYIHVGDAKDPMMIAPMLNGGEGTYDWKQVTAEFTAPAGAHQADLGTVLHGTGTAWFDNVTLERLQEGKLRAKAASVEQIKLNERGRADVWPTGDVAAYDHRMFVRMFNFSTERASRELAFVDAGSLNGRLHGQLNRDAVAVFHDGKRVRHILEGDLMLIEADVPPQSVADYYVYFTGEAKQKSSSTGAASPLLTSDRNLVKNPSFEQGEALPDGWSASGKGQDGVTFGLDSPNCEGLGKRCAKMEVPANTPNAWRGWQQEVPVQAGHSYLLTARIKGKDLCGNARVHVHCHDADGKLCKSDAMLSIGPDVIGTSDWTFLSGRVVAPADAASIQIHLTMDGTGTVWHDGITLTECVPSTIVGLEGRPLKATDPVRVWPMEAVVKVLPDEPAPRSAQPAAIACARNEREPLQLAIRSPRAMQNVRVEVVPPTGANGAKLSEVTVNVIGYVPIDYPTGYYQMRTPAWYRKTPAQPGMCDGWAGLWPDPLLPRDTFDLAANQTQAVWITVGVGKDAPAGDYRGQVRLVAGGKSLAEMPFSVHVWGFTLPDENHVKAIYDVGPRPEEIWGLPHKEVHSQIVRFMADHRLSPDRIRAMPKFQYKDGRATADFREFDKEAEWFFNELKLSHSYMPHDFYLFGWGFPPKVMFGEDPYPGKPPYEDADRSQLRPEYKRAYQACLKAFWDHVKEKGWEEKFVLYISDEPFYWQEPIRKQMRALCEMIHEVSPEIPIYSSTWSHVPGWDGSLDVWGIGHYGIVSTEKMAQIKTGRAKIWFTTDGQMCTDTPLCAVERLLPHYCFKYGADAYEFWGVAWLTYDPYRYGWHAYIPQSDAPGVFYWIRYPNGDGFLLYPGKPLGQTAVVSSIRFEQAREGVEDYEYLYLLQHLVAEAKAAGRDVARAEKALEQASALVAIPNAGGRYSSKILPNPSTLYQARTAVAAAIESLTAGGK